jgi:hypothetical protein
METLFKLHGKNRTAASFLNAVSELSKHFRLSFKTSTFMKSSTAIRHVSLLKTTNLGTEMVSETLVVFNKLAGLIAQRRHY